MDALSNLHKKKPKLGSGERFRQLSSKLAKKRAENPDALAAWIGNKRYGVNKMNKLAMAGKRK